MDRTQQPAQRDVMYCHQCENEWYRDEHGLTCPECQSDFTEVIENDHDPRQDNMHIPADHPEYYAPNQQTHHNHDDHDAPDPDEEDIENIARGGGSGGWARDEQLGPNTFNRTYTFGGGQAQQQGQQQGGGLLNAIGTFIGGALGGGGPQNPQQARTQSPPGAGRASSMPPGGATSTVRHFQGPGFQMTIESHSGGNLYPRNANGPQPFNGQPDHLQDMMHQMMMNIMGPHGMMYHPGMGQGQQQQAPPWQGNPGFGGIFQLLAGGPGGQFGDAVYTQEALDRVITQLMEQHQTGHAPGPASEAAIEALPTRPITKGDLGDSGKAECSICMDDVPLGSTVTELPCHHWFHADCIHAWLAEHDTCPHCRKGITPHPEGENGADANRPRQPGQPPLHDMSSPDAMRPQAVPGGFPSETELHDHWRESARPSSSRQSGTGSGSGNNGSSTGMLGRRMRDVFGGGSGGNQSSGEH